MFDRKQYYLDNQEYIKAYVKQWRQENKGQVAERKKRYYQDNKKVISVWGREYYQNNKEQRKKQSKEYRENNKEYYKEYMKEYWGNHKGERERYSREYRQENKEQISEHMKQWGKTENGKISFKRRNAKRRQLGFFPLNKYFDGCEAHHISQNFVIHLPVEFHQNIRHNIWTGRNMKQINKLAIGFL